LSTKSDERDIFKFFMKAGEVTDVRIIYDRNRPISKGMAYVEFQDKSSIPKALELTGETLRGQKVMVKHSEAEKNIAWEAEQAAKGVTGKGKRGNGDGTQQSGPCALFVAGLHEGLAEEDVKAVFEPFGALDAIEISRDGNGQSNGHGIVQYREWSHAMLAVSQLNGLARWTGFENIRRGRTRWCEE
jgi:RNA-binding protein 39